MDAKETELEKGEWGELGAQRAEYGPNRLTQLVLFFAGLLAVAAGGGLAALGYHLLRSDPLFGLFYLLGGPVLLWLGGAGLWRAVRISFRRVLLFEHGLIDFDCGAATEVRFDHIRSVEQVVTWQVGPTRRGVPSNSYRIRTRDDRQVEIDSLDLNDGDLLGERILFESQAAQVRALARDAGPGNKGTPGSGAK